MSLQEEITRLLQWQANIKGQDQTFDDSAGQVISKVLDAAVSAADEEMSFLDDSVSKDAKSLVLEAINKLRGKR